MKQLSLAAICALAVLTPIGAYAADDVTQTDPVSHAQQRQIALRQLPDPARYADDICWVAPEWRDD